MNKTAAILEVLAMVAASMPNYCTNHYLDKYAADNLADFIETLASRMEQMTGK